MELGAQGGAPGPLYQEPNPQVQRKLVANLVFQVEGKENDDVEPIV